MSQQDAYLDFLARKRILDPMTGITDVGELPSFMKPHQHDITSWALRRGRAAIFAGTGLGKALRFDWPVATPGGWRAIGELAIGDHVIGSNGLPIAVTGVFEQGTRPLVEVTFTDGAKTICDEDHLWTVNTKGRRHRGLPWRVLTTKQIMAEGLDDQQGRRHFIPVCDPVEYPDRELPIDPYTLGVLIGDGSLSQNSVSITTDNAIISRLALPDGIRATVYEENGDFASARLSQGRNGGHIPNPLRAALNAIGFEGSRSEDKFIPSAYAISGINQRRDLLRGLLDTDGHVRPEDGNIEYGSVSERLANDVADLVRSLGGTAAVRVKENCTYVHNGETRIGQTYYRMSVRLPSDWCPFSLPRKADNWRPLTKYPPVRAIASIEPAGEARAVCIKVDAEDELFVTKNYVVTHNTLMEFTWSNRVAEHTGLPVIIFAPLAVAAQHIREAQKFGLRATLAKSQDDVTDNSVYVTNLQKMAHFDLSKFGGVAIDESSCLKSCDSHYRNLLIEECSAIPFRLAATATPAPNDFMELGNHAEFLGVMKYTDMLATFFTHDGGDTQKWRLKGHAENEFWKWMASWAVMIRKPSDLGYDNAGYDLPPLEQIPHTAGVAYEPSIETGLLFPMQATTLQERIGARRGSVDGRVKLAVSVVTADIWDIMATNEIGELPCLDGSQNTTPTAAQKLSAIMSMLRNSKQLEAARQKKTENICAPITPPTKTNGVKGHQKNKLNTTKIGGENTQPIQNSLKNVETQQIAFAKKSEGMESLEPHSASEQENIKNYTSDNMEDAPSVMGRPQAIAESASLLTTATTREQSGDCSAKSAIGVSDCLETSETYSQERSNISTKLKLPHWVIWCHLNSEQDALKKSFGDLAISIHGAHSDEEKESLHKDWLEDKAPVLIVKPSMFGHGLNWQHCNKMIFVGLNDSFEQVYQAIRRCWRFGQTKPVTVHFIAAETEGAVVANLRRKEIDAERMAAAMVAHMADLSAANVRGMVRDRPDYDPQKPMQIPSWLLEDAA